MRRYSSLIVLCIAGLAASAAVAQQPFGEDPNAVRPQPTAPPTEGFWPTRVMLERFIDRITEEMSERYQFDEEQLENTRRLLKENFPKFLSENRAELQTLMNQFMEAQLHDQPPAVEEVSDWARRALPLISKFGDMVNNTTVQMREYMTEEQKITLEGEMAAFNTGLKFAGNKLGVWSDGGYNPELEWPRSPGSRQRRKEEERRMQAEAEAARQQAIAQASGQPVETAAVPAPAGAPQPPPAAKPAAPPAKPAAPADEWTKYVEDFIKRYQLDEAQRNQAHKHLEAAKLERSKYLLKNSANLDRVDKALKEARTDEERTKAKADADKLRAPINRYFQQLKDKLEKIPSQSQRTRAARQAEGKEDNHGKEIQEGAPANRGAKTEGPSSP